MWRLIFFISSFYCLIGSLTSLMASPDWSCGIFSPSTIKWYRWPQFGLTTALSHTSVLPDTTCCRVFSLLVAEEVFLLNLLLKILPMSNNRCCSFPASLKKHYFTPCNFTHTLLSDHVSLPMFYHFIFFFCPFYQEGQGGILILCCTSFHWFLSNHAHDLFAGLSSAALSPPTKSLLPCQVVPWNEKRLSKHSDNREKIKS